MGKISQKEAVKTTGLYAARLRSIVLAMGRDANSTDIDTDIVDAILKEQSTYISFTEYAASKSIGRFNGRSLQHRNALLTELESKGWYGLQVLPPRALVTGLPRDKAFLLRSDISVLDTELMVFFELFGLTAIERVDSLLESAKYRKTTVAALREFTDTVMVEQTITATYVEMVWVVLEGPNLTSMKTSHIAAMLESKIQPKTREHLIHFLTFASKNYDVNLPTISKRGKTVSTPIEAYSDDFYISMAVCLFNPEYVAEHMLIEKALDSHFYAESWLFHVLNYLCAWRSIDICQAWVYPELRKNPRIFPEISRDTLADDLLHDRIPSGLLEDVCNYCLQKVVVSGVQPSKTMRLNPPPLNIAITPIIRPLIGLLVLIGESHDLRTSDGYMRQERRAAYKNWILMKDFYGEKMEELLQGENLQVRRLNKDYLQGIESAAQATGCGGMLAGMVASYARSHINTTSISTYLRDHSLNRENAELVLFFMMERGVLSFEAYYVLKTAYPEAVERLSMDTLNEAIRVLAASPLVIEERISFLQGAQEALEMFKAGDERGVLKILRAMFEISQMRGKGKEQGVYCLKRAAHEACVHPEYGSCLGNCCEYLILTRIGLVPLVELLRDYDNRAAAGDRKAELVYSQILKPRFGSLLNHLMRGTEPITNEKASPGMNRIERMGLKAALTCMLESESTPQPDAAPHTQGGCYGPG